MMNDDDDMTIEFSSIFLLLLMCATLFTDSFHIHFDCAMQ
jgi:hypothetical protein